MKTCVDCQTTVMGKSVRCIACRRKRKRETARQWAAQHRAHRRAYERQRRLWRGVQDISPAAVDVLYQRAQKLKAWQRLASLGKSSHV